MLRIGPLSNIAALLYSNGDDISPLDGVSLVRKKVDTNVILSEDVANFLRKNLTAQSDASTAPNRSRNFVAYTSILSQASNLPPYCDTSNALPHFRPIAATAADAPSRAVTTDTPIVHILPCRSSATAAASAIASSQSIPISVSITKSTMYTSSKTKHYLLTRCNLIIS